MEEDGNLSAEEEQLLRRLSGGAGNAPGYDPARIAAALADQMKHAMSARGSLSDVKRRQEENSRRVAESMRRSQELRGTEGAIEQMLNLRLAEAEQIKLAQERQSLGKAQFDTGLAALKLFKAEARRRQRESGLPYSAVRAQMELEFGAQYSGRQNYKKDDGARLDAKGYLNLLQAGHNVLGDESLDQGARLRKLGEAGLSPYHIRGRVVAGELSEEQGRDLQEQLYGIRRQKYLDTMPSEEGFREWLGETQNAAAYDGANGWVQDTATMHALRREYVNDLAARNSAAVDFDQDSFERSRKEFVDAPIGTISKGINWTADTGKGLAGSVVGMTSQKVGAGARAVGEVAHLITGISPTSIPLALTDKELELIGEQSREWLRGLNRNRQMWFTHSEGAELRSLMEQYKQGLREGWRDDRMGLLAEKMSQKGAALFADGMGAGDTAKHFDPRKDEELRSLAEAYQQTGDEDYWKAYETRMATSVNGRVMQEKLMDYITDGGRLSPDSFQASERGGRVAGLQETLSELLAPGVTKLAKHSIRWAGAGLRKFPGTMKLAETARQAGAKLAAKPPGMVGAALKRVGSVVGKKAGEALEESVGGGLTALGEANADLHSIGESAVSEGVGSLLPLGRVAGLPMDAFQKVRNAIQTRGRGGEAKPGETPDVVPPVTPHGAVSAPSHDTGDAQDTDETDEAHSTAGESEAGVPSMPEPVAGQIPPHAPAPEKVASPEDSDAFVQSTQRGPKPVDNREEYQPPAERDDDQPPQVVGENLRGETTLTKTSIPQESQLPDGIEDGSSHLNEQHELRADESAQVETDEWREPQEQAALPVLPEARAAEDSDSFRRRSAETATPQASSVAAAETHAVNLPPQKKKGGRASQKVQDPLAGREKDSQQQKPTGTTNAAVADVMRPKGRAGSSKQAGSDATSALASATAVQATGPDLPSPSSAFDRPVALPVTMDGARDPGAETGPPPNPAIQTEAPAGQQVVSAIEQKHKSNGKGAKRRSGAEAPTDAFGRKAGQTPKEQPQTAVPPPDAGRPNSTKDQSQSQPSAGQTAGSQKGRKRTEVRVAGRGVINAHLAGTYVGDVYVKENGCPDFSPFAEAQVQLPNLTGAHRKDVKLANDAFGWKSTPEGYTWHHAEDGITMQLIPLEIHNAVRHTGGAAMLRNKGYDVPFPKWAVGAPGSHGRQGKHGFSPIVAPRKKLKGHPVSPASSATQAWGNPKFKPQFKVRKKPTKSEASTKPNPQKKSAGAQRKKK